MSEEGRKAKYVLYPSGKGPWPYVIMTHTRGESVHTDLRMRMNGFLIGHTLFTPGNVGGEYKFDAKHINQPIRGTEKAIQPLWWLLDGSEGSPKIGIGEKFIVPKGEVGATKNYPGVFTILDRGVWWPGALKPWFLEYWLKGKLFPEWTRVTARVFRFRKIDPETKKPASGFEIGTLFQIPGDQTPYVLSKRAKEKGYVPPKGFVPIPPELRRGEEFEEWLAWVQEQWEKGRGKELASSKYVLHEVSWRGQEVIRRLPQLAWYLRLLTGGEVRSWHLWDNPYYTYPVSAFYEGVVEDKWFDYEGELEPQTQYNPNKRLKARMIILTKGSVEVSKEEETEAEVLRLRFLSGGLKGTWVLEQEDKESTAYTLYPLGELSSNRFVLQEHEVEGRVHYDIRLDLGKPVLLEWNMRFDPRKIDSQPAVKKLCEDKSWMEIPAEWTERKVGGLMTKVRTVDKGDVEVFETSQVFYSFNFKGEELKGHYILIKRNEGWRFEKSPIPWKHSLEDPLEGKAFKEPEHEIKLKKLFIYIYDPLLFTRAEPDFREYLPDLKLEEGIEDIIIGLYQVPGKIRYARVMMVVFDPEKWTPEEAKKWVKEKKLKDFVAPQIRHKRKV